MADAIRLALIDDDAAVCDSLQLYFARHNVSVTCFHAADQYLKAVSASELFDCVVTDVRMPGISGLDLVRRVTARGSSCPIILITGHGDVDMAVSAIKSGAFNFIEKPFDEARLLASIRDALETARQKAIDEAQTNELYSRVKALSERQRQVMDLAVAGLSNKEIGSQLNISPKTVENHRAWVMERTGAKNLADLVRIAMQIQARSQRVA
jgi:RNA polymerase sigma factor (sigma-70 family)